MFKYIGTFWNFWMWSPDGLMFHLKAMIIIFFLNAIEVLMLTLNKLFSRFKVEEF